MSAGKVTLRTEIARSRVTHHAKIEVEDVDAQDVILGVTEGESVGRRSLDFEEGAISMLRALGFEVERDHGDGVTSKRVSR